MNILAVDTSTMMQSVALSRGGVLVDSTQFLTVGGHASRMVRTLQDVMERQGLSFDALDALAVGLGPGTFTGLRIGLASLKAVAFAHEMPMYGVPSFLANAALLPEGGALVVALDARKSEVYGAVVTTGPAPRFLVPTNTWSPAVLVERARGCGHDGPLWGCGAGFDVYADSLNGLDAQRLADAYDTPQAAGLLRAIDGLALGAGDAAAVEPLYIRPSEAEAAARRRAKAASAAADAPAES